MERSLRYSSWMLFERKGTVLVLLFVAVLLSGLLWYSTASPLLAAVALSIFLLSMGRAFVPFSFEINADGIVRETLGRKRFIAWEDIRSYRIQSTGILLFPHSDRYPLEPFRGFFLPVPKQLQEDIQNRFILFIGDRQV